MREDTSLGVAESGKVRIGFYDGERWFEESRGDFDKASVLRFPGAPWPPTFEQ